MTAARMCKAEALRRFLVMAAEGFDKTCTACIAHSLPNFPDT